MRVTVALSASAAWAAPLASRAATVCLIDVADELLAAASCLLEFLVTADALGEAAARALAAALARLASLPFAATLVAAPCLANWETLAELAENKTRRALIVAMVADEVPTADSVRAVCLVTEPTLGDAADRVVATARETSAALELLATSKRTKLRRRSTLAAAPLAAARTRRATRVAASEPTFALAADRVVLVTRATDAAPAPTAVRATDACFASDVALEEEAVSATGLDLAAATLARFADTVDAILRACLTTSPTLGETAERVNVVWRRATARLGDAAARATLALLITTDRKSVV